MNRGSSMGVNNFWMYDGMIYNNVFSNGNL